ncbi:DNA recombination protein RmuC [Anaerolineae bacterium]|nr:DNA recombination protein RmuC homolog [Anaerolineaceae bacterium]GDX67791.1 DNA recombination protein RmuC [Anaerolineae bacterium]
MPNLIGWLLLAATGTVVVLQLWALRQRSGAPAGDMLRELELAAREQEKFEARLRDELLRNRDEAGKSTAQLRAELARVLQEQQKSVTDNLDRIRQQGTDSSKVQREELAAQLAQLAHSNEEKLEAVRQTVETKLTQLQTDNAGKLEQMRMTVDEKLQSTLETRLSESFKLVSERLERVHQGLGEMQALASGVGDLKRMLSNVKTRGTWGEMQLSALLEQVLTAEQYAKNVATKPGSADRVEFAIRLPGQSADAQQVVWLPVDAKFPKEDYERLNSALEDGDKPAADSARKALEQRVRDEARTIKEKYIEPPHTTDFAILFLPLEGLYAEVLRVPDIVESLQRDHRVVLAGPTTLAALLNALQMGFRTLAIEKRTSEIWQVLGAVKTEFAKYNDVLQKVREKLQQATNAVEKAEVRTRAIAKQLRNVEELPEPQAIALLGDGDEPAADDD